ncbi:hypothetical protein [Shewanella kaireitica]|nr:hypothetical protein [Shewanella kaireitica]
MSCKTRRNKLMLNKQLPSALGKKLKLAGDEMPLSFDEFWNACK